jgi:cathepsin X
MACSSDSDEGFCGADSAKKNWECKPANIARTCSTFSSMGGECVGLTHFPNATISEYGSVEGMDKIKKELMARGPVACGVDADPLRDYSGGIFDDPDATANIDHVVSIVGWGSDAPGKYYWIVRNSWGEFWGEMGFFRVRAGSNMLGLESECAYAVPSGYTSAEGDMNFPCAEDGKGCTDSEGKLKPELLQNYFFS